MILIFTCQSMRGQEVISATFIGSKTKSQLISQFNVPFIGYGAKYYKVLYTSKDAKGQKDTLSGMLSVPDIAIKRYPRLVYTHGTSDCKDCVPSRYGLPGGEEGQLGLLFAGLGFVSMLPDYVGMGDGRSRPMYTPAPLYQLLMTWSKPVMGGLPQTVCQPIVSCFLPDTARADFHPWLIINISNKMRGLNLLQQQPTCLGRMIFQVL